MKKNKMDIIICSLIKNEHNYLKEWIDYHLSIGFTKIYLFEDYGSTSHKDITDNYDNVILQTLKEYGIEYSTNLCMNQESTYNKFSKNLENKNIWCAFIDVDEFVTLDKEYNNIQEICKIYNQEKGIFLNWKQYGSSGNIYYENKPVRERFTKTCDIYTNDEWCACKSFVNFNNIDLNNIQKIGHHIWIGLKNTIGTEEFGESINYKYKTIWLNHYFTKSWEEWCNRWKLRNDELYGNRYLDIFFECDKEMISKKDELHSIAKNILGEDRYNISIQKR